MAQISGVDKFIILLVAVIAFAIGWFIGKEQNAQELPQPESARSQDLSDNNKTLSLQHDIPIDAIQNKEILFNGAPPVAQRFSVDRGNTKKLTRDDESTIIGLAEVDSEYIKINLNNEEHLLESGNYLDVKLKELNCRLLLLNYDWSITMPSADFSYECDAKKTQ